MMVLASSICKVNFSSCQPYQRVAIPSTESSLSIASRNSWKHRTCDWAHFQIVCKVLATKV